MKRILLVVCACLVLGPALLWLLGRGSHSRQRPEATTLLAPHAESGTLTTNPARDDTASKQITNTVMTARPRTSGLTVDTHVASSPGGDKGREVKTQWTPYSVWTEEVPMDSNLASKLDEVMQSWRLAFDFQNKRPGATNLAEAHGLLYESVNMAIDGAPLKSVEYRDVFFFSGGTRAYHVSDFSTGIAIPKGKAIIFEWGN